MNLQKKEDEQVLVAEHYEQIKVMLEESEIDFHLDRSTNSDYQFIEILENEIVFVFNKDGSLDQVTSVE